MSKIKPSEEQQLILDTYANTEKNIAISAYAGSGKTSTLLMLSHANPETAFAYLAFNKDIIEDSKKKMPSNVDCMTIHSAAYQHFAVYHYGDKLRYRLIHGGLRSKDIIKTLNCNPTGRFTIIQTGNLIKKVLDQFLTTDVEEFSKLPITKIHIDNPDGAKYAGKPITVADLKYVTSQAEKLWNMMIDPDGYTPFTHGVYLKGWQIFGSKYVFPYDTVMLDEAQDCNPIMLKIILNSMNGSRKIFVGDDNQLIYRWNGCINAMNKLPGSVNLKLTRTYRFGKNILEPTNKILKMLNEKNPPMVGLDVNGETFDEDKQFTVLCRTNAEVITTALHYAEKGKKIAINKGFATIYNSLMYLHLLNIEGNINNVRNTIEMEGLSKGILSNDYSSYHSSDEITAELEGGGEHGLKRDWNFAKNEKLPEILAKIESSCAKRFSKSVNVFISTAHRAKGLEWDQVKLAGDFCLDINKEKHKEEWNLNYVAITRAKQALSAPSLLIRLKDETFIEDAIRMFSYYE